MKRAFVTYVVYIPPLLHSHNTHGEYLWPFALAAHWQHNRTSNRAAIMLGYLFGCGNILSVYNNMSHGPWVAKKSKHLKLCSSTPYTDHLHPHLCSRQRALSHTSTHSQRYAFPSNPIKQPNLSQRSAARTSPHSTAHLTVWIIKLCAALHAYAALKKSAQQKLLLCIVIVYSVRLCLHHQLKKMYERFRCV